MQAARPARSGAGCEIAGEHRLGPGCESGDFFVPNMHPLDVAAPDGIRDEVQRITRHAPAVLHASSLQRFHNDIGNSFGHFRSP
jgi:hypothetical protein